MDKITYTVANQQVFTNPKNVKIETFISSNKNVTILINADVELKELTLEDINNSEDYWELTRFLMKIKSQSLF